MVLSKRERYVAIAAIGSVAVLALDHFALDPLLASSVQLDSQIGVCSQQMDKARRLFSSSGHRGRLWAEMQNKGLRRKDASEAESQALNSIRDWAQEAGLGLSSVKPERTEKEKDFQKSTFHVAGTGGMAQISRFLWHLQTAEIPVRISDLQINTRKEGTDDLTLQLNLSTIYLPHEGEKERSPAGSNAREVQR